MKRVLLAALLPLAACGNDNDPTALARVDRVLLAPADTTIEHPTHFRYRITLLDANGDVIDDGVDRPAEFSASNQAAVNVSDFGIVETEASGSVVITARVGGSAGTAALLVTDTATAEGSQMAP